MESRMSSGFVKKRHNGEMSNSITSDEVFRFKILLPNGTSVNLTLRDPGPKMPVDDFIGLVKSEYTRSVRRSEQTKDRRRVNWSSELLILQDANDVKMGSVFNFKIFKPHKCHILRLHDGGGENTNMFENMWDLTPDTDLLKELPEEYTFETALADLIDNSLQAVWSNSKNDRPLISVQVLEDKISIFDSGPGMDGSDENSIVKWGKMGSSLHRSSKEHAVGGKPPYLMPYFGMFGYGGPIASMHLGRRALVSSKTKLSKKVFILHLEREALLSNSGSDQNWKTTGGIRDPLEDEIAIAPHGSFTKVEIFDPVLKSLDIGQLQCWLKDIYFPYIQCDEASTTGKTITPVEFEVNGTNLAEIQSGEVATTNLHSSNGPDFILQLHFSLKQNSVIKSSGSRSCQEANARLKCVYFPIIEGKESIQMILEELESNKHNISDKYENFSRVSIRRLGRLLPDARWPWLPFMDLRHKKGSSKAQLLKRCCSRVKCFIDTDAGINPTPSKTDLAHRNPFTIALKNFGNNLLEVETGVDINVRRDGKLLSPSQLEKDYQDWILRMHKQYDEEVDRGEDQPIIVVSPVKRNKIGVSSDVVRFHKILKRKGETWKSGQKIKLLKGACAGVHKKNVYATIEYFLLGGFEGDAGGEAQIICRPIDIPEKNGCKLSEVNENPSFDLRKSMCIPISVIDSGMCISVESIEWKKQMEKELQKSPSTIELLSAKHCQELDIDGEELQTTVKAGKAPPKEVVAVVRPANYVSESDTKYVDQKYIIKSYKEMSLEAKFNDRNKDAEAVRHVYSTRIAPLEYKGIHGLYVFPLACKFPKLFEKVGTCTFSFSVIDGGCKTCVREVVIHPSSKIGKWKLLSKNKSRLNVRIGSLFGPLYIACYDVYGNRTGFPSSPKVLLKLEAREGVRFHVKDFKTELSTSKSELKVENILIESCDLDKIQPAYEATLVISTSDESFSVSVGCCVNPGCIDLVKVEPSIPMNQLLPASIVKDLKFQMFDAYGNHAMEGSEVLIKLEGFKITDNLGLKRQVDDHGCVDLSGILKVTAGYGKKVSFSVLSEDKVFLKQEFQVESRELRIESKVPEFLTAGSMLEDITFEIVNSNGVVDDTIHHEEKNGLLNMLTIKAGWLNTEESIRYMFKHGRCTVPSIPLPQEEGNFRFEACHSHHANLSLIIEFQLVKPPVQHDSGKNESPCSGGKPLLLQDSSHLMQVGKNFILSTESNIKELEADILKIGSEIKYLESRRETLIEHKEQVEQIIKELQDSSEPCLLGFPNRFSNKEEVVEEIEKRDCSAAAILCNISKRVPFQEPNNPLVKDIIGIVALLGRVHSIQLSRVLSEYLGEDQMLAVVSKSFEAASALEKYQQNGEVDFSNALHAEANRLGKTINSRFLVICLEDIRPFTNIFGNGDPQGKLEIPFSSQYMPSGFLGFAVNMVDLDKDQLRIKTSSGHGLRATLLYRLFGELHVYRTREEMFAARACIEQGAVSLDGGILKENGMISLGFGDPAICFQVVPPKSEMSCSQAVAKQLEELRADLKKTNEVLAGVMKNHKKSKRRFEKKSEEFNKLINNVRPLLGTQETMKG